MRRGPHDGEERDADVDARLIEVEDRGEELAADHLLQHVQLQQEEGDPCGGGSRSPLRKRRRHQELALSAFCNRELDAVHHSAQAAAGARTHHEAELHVVQAVVADLVPDDGADLVVRHLRQHRVEETDAPEPHGAARVVIV